MTFKEDINDRFTQIETNFAKAKAAVSKISTSGSGGTATDVQINGTSITSNDVANIVTNSAYNASSNKIATMSDLPTIDSALSSTSTNPVQNKVINSALSNKYDASNPNGYTSNVGTVTKVNNTSPDSSGNVTLSIPAAQVNSDWNASSGVAQILNKPTLSTVATSGSYNDLADKPTIPSAVTESTVSGWGFTKNTGTVTSVNNVSPVNGNVSLTIPTVDQSFDGTSTNAESGVSILGLLQTIYPVGSVYLSTNATCPLASLFGTWTLVSSGRALWTGTGSDGDTTIPAGLPTIKGNFAIDKTSNNWGSSYVDGAFFSNGTTAHGNKAAQSGEAPKIGFNALLSSSIYGNSTTVQPPAYVVNVWRRTA